MMPICLQPGCPAVVDRGRCAEHRRQVEAIRGSRQERGYDERWVRAAKAFKLEYPLCGMRPGGVEPVMSRCFELGRTTAGFQVDHVIPHKGNDRLFWDREHNWQTLCRECGARKSQAGF